LKWFFLIELKVFDQARVLADSVNRTGIRCQRALNATLLHRVQIADEKSLAFSIYYSMLASITTACGQDACDWKICIALNPRKMLRGGSGSGNKPVAPAEEHSAVIAIFAEHSTAFASGTIIFRIA
jgi:hypothetical protein